MKLEDLTVYRMAMELGDDVWKIVESWQYFEKDTIGKQLTRAVDSIAANLSEGLGRYHYGETLHFNYYARGSLFETKTWLEKAFNRKLIPEEEFKKLFEECNILGIKINNYINSLKQHRKK